MSLLEWLWDFWLVLLFVYFVLGFGRLNLGRLGRCMMRVGKNKRSWAGDWAKAEVFRIQEIQKVEDAISLVLMRYGRLGVSTVCGSDLLYMISSSSSDA